MQFPAGTSPRCCDRNRALYIDIKLRMKNNYHQLRIFRAQERSVLSRVFMNDEVVQLFRFLTRLLDSCADHDVITDALVTPADPEAYHAALDGIRSCIGHIQASGITSDQLACIISRTGSSHPPLFPGGTIDPVELIPLILAGFTSTQETLVCSACNEWGQALDPANPEETATLIRSRSPRSPLPTCSPPRDPHAAVSCIPGTRGGRKDPSPRDDTLFEADGRILIAPSDDPALFPGKSIRRCSGSLYRQGNPPRPVLSGPRRSRHWGISASSGKEDQGTRADFCRWRSLLQGNFSGPGRPCPGNLGWSLMSGTLFRVSLDEGVAGEDTALTRWNGSQAMCLQG